MWGERAEETSESSLTTGKINSDVMSLTGKHCRGWWKMRNASSVPPPPDRVQFLVCPRRINQFNPPPRLPFLHGKVCLRTILTGRREQPLGTPPISSQRLWWRNFLSGAYQERGEKSKCFKNHSINLNSREKRKLSEKTPIDIDIKFKAVIWCHFSKMPLPFVSEYVLIDITLGTFLTNHCTSGLVRGTRLAHQLNVSYH